MHSRDDPQNGAWSASKHSHTGREAPSYPIPRRTLLWALAGAGTCAQAQPHEIRISNGDWAPFMSPTLPHYGFVSRIVTEAFRLEDVTVKYEFFPWARAYLVAKQGAFDASIGWYWNAERAEDFLFSDPVFVETQVLFTLRDRPVAWTRLEDLKDKHIGATLGYTYGEAFQKLEAQKWLHVERTGSDEQNLRKLLAQRLDAVVISKVVGERLLVALGDAAKARIAIIDQPVNSGPLHLIFPKALAQSAQWLHRFNRGLRKLKAAGAIERLSRPEG